MEKVRAVFETEVFRSLLFTFMTLLSVWPFLTDEKVLSFRKIFLFLFVGWAVLITFLFLISVILGWQSKGSGE